MKVGSKHKSCWLFTLLLALFARSAAAHVGSPIVFFEGQAGPYPVHVVIRPAEVIPGLAEISVRIDAGGVERVTPLPNQWKPGRKGAPPPGVPRPARRETNPFHAEPWFSEPGAPTA